MDKENSWLEVDKALSEIETRTITIRNGMKEEFVVVVPEVLASKIRDLLDTIVSMM